MIRRLTCVAVIALLLLARSAFPAGCAGTGSCFYICGGSASNTNVTTCWATTSGGSTTGSVPTATDDCIFNGSSGGTANATVNATLVCKNLTTTGWAGTLVGGAANININGNIVLDASTVTTAGSTFDFVGSSSSSLTSNGGTNNWGVRTNGTGLTLTLNDDLTFGTQNNIAPRLIVLNGGFNANGHNITCNRGAAGPLQCFTIQSNTNTRPVTLGSGRWKVVSGIGGAIGLPGGFNPATSTGYTLSAASAVLEVQQDDTTAGVTTLGTFPAGTVIGALVTSGSSTTRTVALPAEAVIVGSLTVGKDITTTFTTSSVLTITSSFATTGASGHLAVLNSTTSGTAARILKSGGAVSADFLSVKDLRCEGACCYAGAHSTNVSGNAGWIFVTNSPVCPTGAFFGGGI